MLRLMFWPQTKSPKTYIWKKIRVAHMLLAIGLLYQMTWGKANRHLPFPMDNTQWACLFFSCFLAHHRPPKLIVLCQIEERLVIFERIPSISRFLLLSHTIFVLSGSLIHILPVSNALLHFALRKVHTLLGKPQIVLKLRPFSLDLVGRQWGWAACPAGGAY